MKKKTATQVMSYLLTTAMITLTVTFRYEGKHYSFTIPARKVGGKDNVLTETDPVTGEIVNWYGFLHLSEKYGRKQVD